MSANLTLNLQDAPAELTRSNYPEPGDVYSKAGGQPGFWVIVFVNSAQCCVLAFDMEGQVTGASRYGLSYFRDNSHRRVGTVEIPTFNVVWDAPR